MKKLLLSILTLASFATFAQKDLGITLLAPTNGTEINSGKAFPVAFTIKNYGSTAIMATDSFRISLYLVTSSVTQLGSFSAGKALNGGDSANYLLSNQVGVTFPSDMDSAYFIATVAFKDTIANVDVNDSNDGDIAIVNLRVNKTGVAETHALANSVKAYPNPANAEFTVTMKSSDAKVEVLDITGKLVSTHAVVMGEARMDVSSYNNGVYFYQVKDAAGSLVKTGKFTVSH